MTAVSLRSSTAVIVVLSLLQPLPTLAQSPARPDGVGGASAENRNRQADRRTSEEICAEAMIFDAIACELHILSLEGEVEADTPAAPVERAAPEAATRPDRPAEAREEAAAREEALASEEAEAREEAASGTEAASETEAPAEAAIRVEAERAEEAATEPAPQSEPAVVAQDCLAEIVASDGTIVCADALTGETIAAIAAETDAEADTGADVIVETITESSSRSAASRGAPMAQSASSRCPPSTIRPRVSSPVACDSSGCGGPNSSVGATGDPGANVSDTPDMISRARRSISRRICGARSFQA
jgi:hypothetical protein